MIEVDFTRQLLDWSKASDRIIFDYSEAFDGMTLLLQAHSLSSRGKTRGGTRSSASSSSSTLTPSSSDVSIKQQYTNNKDSLNNNESIIDSQGASTPGTEPKQLEEAIQHQQHSGSLYREPRLNKSDSASLSHHQMFLDAGSQGSNVPLSPNSIDNRLVQKLPLKKIFETQWLITIFRLRAIQISISHDQLNNYTNSNNEDHDLLATSNEDSPISVMGSNTLMPIVQQPRRPIGRESFRMQQRNAAGCVPQNLVFREQPNLNIDNCFLLKSQLRR